MMHPANDKILALSVVAAQQLQQGTVLKFQPSTDGSGRLYAVQSISSADQPSAGFGIFLAYFIPNDSTVTEFQGPPESTTFTLNTGTGIAGGINTILSGTECVALGGGGIALVRLDKNAMSLSGVAPYVGVIPQPSTVLKYDGTTGLLDPAGSVNISSALVVQNDVATIVALLA